MALPLKHESPPEVEAPLRAPEVQPRAGPRLVVRRGYLTWLNEVRSTLAARNMDVDAWGRNWPYDFRKEYEEGSSPASAAQAAYDYWWQEVLAESWT